MPPQITLNGNSGLFTFIPDANFNGTLTMTYRVSDGVLVSNNVGTATFIVREVNDAPIANNDTITSSEDVQLTLTAAQLFANDSKGPGNESGQTLTITGVQSISAQAGSVSLVAGQIVYTPPTDFSGTDTFTYTITDNGTTGGLPAPLSSTATVTIVVLDKNDAPTTGPDSLTINEDTPGTITSTTLLSNDSPGPANEANQLLQLVRVLPQSTAGGTVTLSGSQVVYTPPADFAGTDTFFYEVQDNGLSGNQPDPQKSTGTVTVTVNNVSDAPRVQTALGTRTVNEDSPAISIDLTTIFTDPDVITSGDSLTYSVVGNSNAALVTPNVTGSTLTLPLQADANGQALVRVQARDIAGQTVVSTLTLNVIPVNDPPRLITAIPDVTMNEDDAPRDIQLSPSYFFDPDLGNGDTLSITLVSNTNSLVVTPTIIAGGIRLTLVPNQFGASQITVRATDSTGLAVTDNFVLTVNSVNDAPTTAADTYNVPQFGTLVANDARGGNAEPNDNGVLANDIDPEGSSITAQIVKQPSFGTITFNNNGTFTYVHTGSTRANDTFTYRATDGSATSTETTVTIVVGAPLPPPHQNPANQFDVNADGFVSAIDALLVINRLNISGPGPVTGLSSPPPYLDVSGDNQISARDALLVINQLNSRGSGEGEGSEMDALASASAFQYCASRVNDNQVVSVTSIPVMAGEVYGPVQALELGLTAALDELEGSAEGEVAYGWPEIQSSAVRHEAADEALDSLLADMAFARKK